MADMFNVANGPDFPMLGGEVRLQMTRVHQQAAIDEVGEKVYATQIIQNGFVLNDEAAAPPDGTRAAHGDLAINEVDLGDGTRTGVMYVRGFDHGASLGVESVGGAPWIWMTGDVNEAPIGENGYGTKVVRFPFENNGIIDWGDAGLDVYDPIPGSDHVTVSLDKVGQQVGVLAQYDGSYTYNVYDLDDFKARNFNAKWTAARQQAAEFQAWTLCQEFIYQFTGFSYSETNPPPPDGQGTSYFTVYNMPTGQVVQRVHNLRHLDLVYRESESITTWDAPGGPRLVYGFATQEPPRRMALYYIEQTSSQDISITAAATDSGVGITTTVADRTTVQRWEITRTASNVAVILFSGTGADLPNTATWNDPAPPGCVAITYRLIVYRTTGGQDAAEAAPVTWVPPGGCGGGGGGGAVMELPESLGCPDDYIAELTWRGGARPYTQLTRLTAVSWSRTLNDISDASVSVLKGNMTPECCEALGRTEPWVHELTIYRQGELVWQGPITKTTERRDSFLIEAQDVFAWLDKIVNTFLVRYVNATADARGRRRAPVTYIAYNHIRLNLEESSLSVPPDYPGIMDYIVRRDTPNTIKFEKDGSANTTVWTEYLGNILRELAKRGLTWTTVGRTLLLRGRPTKDTLATARLTMDHFAGDIELIKDGTQAATYAFATSQQSQDISDGRTVGTGRTGTPYGRLDTLVRLQEEDASPDDLRAAARSALAGRYPVPVAISVPDGSQLATTAPVTIQQLVPGERIDMLTDTMCTPVSQGFILSDVEVTWEQGGEKVGITLVPLADIDEELEQ